MNEYFYFLNIFCLEVLNMKIVTIQGGVPNRYDVEGSDTTMLPIAAVLVWTILNSQSFFKDEITLAS